MKTVRVGMIGAGFSAGLHAEGITKVYGVDARIVAVAAGSLEHAAEFAAGHAADAETYDDYRQLLADPSIDVVCVCVPNSLHEAVIIEAARAGKHIICEKPLTGAFGVTPSLSGVGRGAAEADRAQASLDELSAVLAGAGVLFMYAENWIYAPAMTKTKALLERSKGTVLDIRAEESHSGSHAARTRRRETAGGGALLTLGSHAVGFAIHLKQHEARLAGRPDVHVEAVTADLATFDRSETPTSPVRSWLVEDWDDVERWANVVLRFTDGTRAAITASFSMLGGTKNEFEVYTTNAAFHGKITPNNGLLAFTPDDEAFGDEYLHEKVESRTGWISASPDEDWARGYPQEMQDFMTCVAEGTQPVSGFGLAREVVEVIYAGYVSAEEGRRVELSTAGHGQMKTREAQL